MTLRFRLPADAPSLATLPLFELPLITLTPLLGGGPKTRHVDANDVVRAPNIRGQLRMWWRAIHAPVYAGQGEPMAALFDAEADLWGGVPGGNDTSERGDGKVQRSKVIVTVGDVEQTEIEDRDIELSDKDAYALWAARATHAQAPAERWAAGVRFRLRIEYRRGAADRDRTVEIERSLRAFLIFGGVGGRARRGCGALAVEGDEARATWLPPSMQDTDLAQWLGLTPAGLAGFHAPLLRGSTYRVGTSRPPVDHVLAWYDALAWLRDFRQGAARFVDTADAGTHARQRPILAQPPAGRPGRSRWPEADKLRRRAGAGRYDHAPFVAHSNNVPAWPRASFGLPLQFQFQKFERNRQAFIPPPPDNAQLSWALARGGDPIDRLASPLIVKPVQLRSGDVAALALWLQRAIPPDAVVAPLVGPRLDTAWAAPLSQLLPPGHTALYAPLVGKADLRDAFMSWLATHGAPMGGLL